MALASELADDRRTSFLVRILAHSALIHLVGFVLLYLAWYKSASLMGMADWPVREVHAVLKSPPETSWRQLMHSCIVLAAITPGAIGILATLCPLNMSLQQKHAGRVREWKNLYIVLVTKGTNQDTVERSVGEMRYLQTLDSRIRFVVLTDEGPGSALSEAKLGVGVVVVPRSFAPATARYKARALEYFRRAVRLSDVDDWVLHLDEETAVDAHCVRACVAFIEREGARGREWGQGVIVYNTVNYWRDPLLTFAELVRFRDDLGRFQLMHGRLHVPVWGCHGSFLLASGRAENAVGWDTACLAEDFWFANEAWWRFGYGGGFVPSVAREQSNWSVMDLMKQRRRWFCGMWEVGVFGKLSVVSWCLSNFELVVVLCAWLYLLDLPLWLQIGLSMYYCGTTVTLIVATVLSDSDAGVPPWPRVIHVLLIPLLSFFSGFLQIAAVTYSILRPAGHAHGFQVVKKG